MITTHPTVPVRCTKQAAPKGLVNTSAVLYSLVVSCKRLGVDPYAYLRDVIGSVATYPNKRIGDLTPRAWAAARAPEHENSVALG